MTSPCENCPSQSLLEEALKERHKTKYSRYLNVVELAKCTLRDIFMGHTADVQKKVESCERSIGYYNQLLPDEGKAAIEDCTGPFEIFNYDNILSDDNISRDLICGSYVTDHVNGRRLNAEDSL